MAHDLATGGTRPNSSLLAQLLLALDSRLRDRHSVFEYTSHPDCILRIGIAPLDRTVSFADGRCGQAGDRLVDLHLWNEHIPPMSQEGASVGWARRMHRGMIFSLRELARFLDVRRDLDDIRLLRANTNFVGPRRRAQNVRLMRGYGFEPPIEIRAYIIRVSHAANGSWVCHRAWGSAVRLPPEPPRNRPGRLPVPQAKHDSRPVKRQVLDRKYLNSGAGALS